MELRRISLVCTVGANTSKPFYFAPPLADDGTTSRVWEYVDLDIVPNEASAANGTDYADIALFRDDGTPTQITVTRSTASTGLSAGVPVNPATHASAVGDKLKATRTDPFYLQIDATPGAGVAVNIVATLTVREYTV